MIEEIITVRRAGTNWAVIAWGATLKEFDRRERAMEYAQSYARIRARRHG